MYTIIKIFKIKYSFGWFALLFSFVLQIQIQILKHSQRRINTAKKQHLNSVNSEKIIRVTKIFNM